MVWTVWILRCITIGMVHSVKNGISPWRQIGTALTCPSEKVKELFPEFVHDEHLVGCIAVQKETLAKQGEIPVKKEEYY